MTYDIVVTAVSERADLFAESLASLIANVDVLPQRVIVHEDVREGSKPGEIHKALDNAVYRKGQPPYLFSYLHVVTDPAAGMGPGMLWGFEQATAPFVLYTQEDWLVLRALPVRETLALMEAHGLNHVRWNKRKTMRAKHEDDPARCWRKVEKRFGERVLTVSDHWYTQTSLWRRDVALPGLRAAAAQHSRSEQFVAAFNRYMNTTHGDPARSWNDQEMRHERLRTYIYGGVGEPAFIRHLGSLRGTGIIKDHLKEV